MTIRKITLKKNDDKKDNVKKNDDKKDKTKTLCNSKGSKDEC